MPENPPDEQKPAASAARDKPEDQKTEEPPRKRRRLGPAGWLILIAVLVAVGVGGFFFWRHLQTYESTDDAQIDGDIYPITSRIAGTVRTVHADDNQEVRAGDLLVELDPSDYDVALAQARAALTESRTQVAVAQPNVPITSTTTETTVTSTAAELAGASAQVAAAEREREVSLAQVRQAEAENVKAQADLARFRQLVEKDEISRQQYDQAEANAKATAAQVEARRAAVGAAARNVDAAEARARQAETRQAEARAVRPAQIAVQNALVRSREASAERQQTLVNQALLNVSYTKIFAPVSGVIGRKNVQPGQHVTAGQQLMVDVPLDDVWVTANFKETQLKRMRPQQRVSLRVDAYDKEFEGYLESLAPASGARFSLLPPENATGNYVKVVQRVPVRIRLKPGQDPEHRLRPGMSVEPTVWLQ